jgi:hypothetical protein
MMIGDGWIMLRYLRSFRKTTMKYACLKYGLVAGVAGALALAAMTPSVAAPVYNDATAIKFAATSDVVDVRWRGRGGWIAGGLALGALAARPYYYDSYYYGPAYGPAYGPPAAVYAPPPGPVYAEPYPDANGPARQCWIPTDRERGFGYYRPC